MKKILALMLSLCLIGGILTACGEETEVTDAELIGTWVSDYFDTGYIFNEDYTGTDTFFDLSFTYTAEEGTIIITYDEEIWGTVEYTYEITDDELTMTRVSSDDDDDPDPYTYTRESTEAEEETEEETTEEESEEESAAGDETESSEDTE